MERYKRSYHHVHKPIMLVRQPSLKKLPTATIHHEPRLRPDPQEKVIEEMLSPFWAWRFQD